jgi:hypothetical protein
MTLGYCQAFLLFVTKSLITYKIAWYNGSRTRVERFCLASIVDTIQPAGIKHYRWLFILIVDGSVVHNRSVRRRTRGIFIAIHNQYSAGHSFYLAVYENKRQFVSCRAFQCVPQYLRNIYSGYGTFLCHTYSHIDPVYRCHYNGKPHVDKTRCIDAF